MSDVDVLTFAVLAVALSPLAHWVLGPSNGYRKHGTSSPLLRNAIVLGYLMCIAVAVSGALR